LEKLSCIAIVDAMNTQKDTVRKIFKEKKKDYVVALTVNHPVMYNRVKEYFEKSILRMKKR
jgi:hypothetical protein